MKCIWGLVLGVVAVSWPALAWAALGPGDVYLLINQNVAESREIAEYYCAKRGVPVDHIVSLALPANEDITRVDYEQKLAGPLREKLLANQSQVKVLLTIYGVPLRVGGQLPTEAERLEAAEVSKQLIPLEQQKKDLDAAIKILEAKTNDKGSTDDERLAADRDLTASRKERKSVDAKTRTLEFRARKVTYAESHAAVDSELALLWQKDYDLRRYQANLLNFLVPEGARATRPPMLMTCRLDGPGPDIVKRMIDQSLETEAKGLQGNVYVDARGIVFNPAEGGQGYGAYDESMREMALLLEQAGQMTVALDDKPALFAPGSCADCALYCGWYSHANFVDCCRFVPGAVAWHLASSEAVTLRDPKSKVWCPNLLQKGVAATLGPVSEPYTIGFPKPAEFFGTLVTGQFTLVESYWRTQLYASWMTVLVGDPLYNPYAKTPHLKIEQVRSSPAVPRPAK